MLCMLIYFEYTTAISSLIFEGKLNWLLIFIATFFSKFLSSIFTFIASGILQLINPFEHLFDNRRKYYLRNNKSICRFDEIQNIYIRSRTLGSNEHSSKWYELYFFIRSRKPIKLMKTNLEDRAIYLKDEIISTIGLAR